MTRIVLRPLASPLPLTFFAFGAGSLMNGLYETTAASGFEITSGILGCVIAAIALYGGLTLGLEDLQDRAVPPSAAAACERNCENGSNPTINIPVYARHQPVSEDAVHPGFTTLAARSRGDPRRLF